MTDFRKYKDQLAAAGYTVSDDGKSVKKEGAYIAGNTEGGTWSGSRSIDNIVSGEPDKKPKKAHGRKARSNSGRGTTPKQVRPRARRDTVKPPSPVSVTTLRPASVSRSRGDGMYEMNRRAIDRVPAGASMAPARRKHLVPSTGSSARKRTR